MGEDLRRRAQGWDLFPGDKVCSELYFSSLSLMGQQVCGRGRGHIEGLVQCSQEREWGGQEMMEVTDADGLCFQGPVMIPTGH